MPTEIDQERQLPANRVILWLSADQMAIWINDYDKVRVTVKPIEREFLCNLQSQLLMKLQTANEMKKYAKSKQFATKQNGKNNYLQSNLSAALARINRERQSGLIYVNGMPKIAFETKAREPEKQNAKMTNCIRRTFCMGLLVFSGSVDRKNDSPKWAHRVSNKFRPALGYPFM